MKIGCVFLVLCYVLPSRMTESGGRLAFVTVTKCVTGRAAGGQSRLCPLAGTLTAVTHGSRCDRTEWLVRPREKVTGERIVFMAKVRPIEPGGGGGAGLRNGERGLSRWGTVYVAILG